MTAAEFFDRAKAGDKVRLNGGLDLYEVRYLAKGSYARLAKVGEETVTAFVYLHGESLRFENLNGPHYESVELVSRH